MCVLVSSIALRDALDLFVVWRYNADIWQQKGVLSEAGLQDLPPSAWDYVTTKVTEFVASYQMPSYSKYGSF